MFHRWLDVHPLTAAGSATMFLGSIEQLIPAILVGAVFAAAGIVADLLVVREIRRHHAHHREQLEALFALHQARMHPHAATRDADGATDPH